MLVRDWKNVYMIGIRGAGVSALAELLAGWGISVTGSDAPDSFSTDSAFKDLGITVIDTGFAAENIPDDADVVVRSNAYGEDNVEVAEAILRKLPVFSYPQAIGMLFDSMRGIAIAGTHGKSTTVAMLGVILEQAGLDPTVIVGATVKQWRRKTRVGDSQWLVVEADEYRRAFHNYNPFGIVITNIDYDHPDVYPSLSEYREAFDIFLKKIDPMGFIIGPILSVPDDFRPKLRLPGEHNRANAFAAFEAAQALSVDDRVAMRALENFKGIGRRFELLCDRRINNHSVVIIEDYAHHPTEVRSTIAAALEHYPYREIWAVFQPHTFTRTEKLFYDFTTAFEDADRVFISDIYASVREKVGKISSKDLVNKIGFSAVASGDVVATQDRLEKELKRAEEDIVVIIMGAGDIREVASGLCHV